MAGRELEQIGNAYGIKIIGFNNVLFVSPHSAEGHEKPVHELVARVCAATGSSAIINTQIPRAVMDLNDYKQIKNVSSGAVFQYKEDLVRMINDLQERYEDLVVIFVHFCPRIYARKRALFARDMFGKLVTRKAGDRREYAIDLGCGYCELSFDPCSFSQKFLFAKDVISSRGRGNPTCNSDVLKKIRKSLWTLLQKHLDGWQAGVAIGREWAAANPNNMVQVVKKLFPEVNVLQMEIINDLELELIYHALVAMVPNIS